MLVKIVSGQPERTTVTPSTSFLSNIDKGFEAFQLVLYRRFIEGGVVKSIAEIDLTEPNLGVRLLFPNDVEYSADIDPIDGVKGVCSYTLSGEEFLNITEDTKVKVRVSLIKQDTEPEPTMIEYLGEFEFLVKAV